MAAVFNRRSRPDRRSLPDRLSPCNRFFFSDRVSAPRRRSRVARLSTPDRLLFFVIAAPLISTFVSAFGKQVVKSVNISFSENSNFGAKSGSHGRAANGMMRFETPKV